MLTRIGILGVAAAILCGCGPLLTAASPTPSADFVTATLPASPSPSPSAAPDTATPEPTTAPLVGTTTTQINVRPEPLSSSSPIGLLGPASSVSVLGKDPGGHWYQILYDAGPDGTAWVAAEYVKVQDERAIQLAGGEAPNLASVREQINVRSGPGTTFDGLGTLSARDVVTLTGKDSAETWLQIEFAAGPGGKGWVAASFLEAFSAENLPIVDDSGEIVGTSTPTGVPPTPAPTVAAAIDDQDSPDAPSVDVTFSPTGAGSLLYSSDLSEPEGDASDWMRFTIYYPEVRISLDCTGNGGVSAELLEQGKVLPESRDFRCGGAIWLRLTAGQSYTLRLTIIPGTAALTYVHYRVGIYGAASP